MSQIAPALVDTSVFIDFFRGLLTAETALFEKLIDADRVAFCGMVEAEIRYGLRATEKSRVLELLQGFHRLEMVEADYSVGGEIGNELRSSGVTVPLADCLIAAVAIRTKSPLLSSDAHHRLIPNLRFVDAD